MTGRPGKSATAASRRDRSWYRAACRRPTASTRCIAPSSSIPWTPRWADRIDWEELLYRQSLTWRKVPEADRAGIDRDKALAMILEHPTLLKRPVLEHRDYIAVGFSEARFSEFLK